MKTKKFLMAALVVSMSGSYGIAQEIDSTTTASTADAGSTEASANVSSETQKFMDEAATGGMMEVALGSIAQEKASSPAVKEFGGRMVTDHTKAGDELKSLAQEKSVTLPEAMTSKQQRSVDKLSELSGEEFDKEYMKMMVKDHEKDVKAYQKASEKVPDPAVQGFASKTLPTLKGHLQEAQSVNDQLQNL